MRNFRTIKASEVIADIRAGASNLELMAKYHLSWERLQHVLKQLVNQKALRLCELEERGAYYDDPLNRWLTRGTYRARLRIPVPVRDLGHAANQGCIIDLSEKGFRAIGFAVNVNERKSFLVKAADVSTVSNFSLNATCKWAKVHENRRRVREAGFSISEGSDAILSNIRQLMRTLLSLGDSNLGSRTPSQSANP